MYSYEQRVAAVKLLIQYDMNIPQISLAVPGMDLKRTRLNAPSTNDDTVHIMNPDAVMVSDNTLTIVESHGGTITAVSGRL